MNPFLEDDKAQTVQQRFEDEKIDLDFLERLEDINFYWQTCINFVTEVWQRDITSLTPRQKTWLDQIVDDCVEKRINGKHHV